MEIDIERLRVDAAYWDQVAPEGAEFYAQEIKNWGECWYKSSPYWSAYFGGCWNEFGQDDELLDAFIKSRVDSLTPRPQPTTNWHERGEFSPQGGWNGFDGGLMRKDDKKFTMNQPPKRGDMVQCLIFPDHACEIIGWDVIKANAVNVVVKLTPKNGLPFYDAFAGDQFRPIRTQQDIEREELESIIFKTAAYGGSKHEIADAILKAGYRKEPKP